MKKILLLSAVLNLLSEISFAQYPLVSINDVQQVSAEDLSNGIDTSAYYGDTIEIEGIVIFDPCDYGLSTSGSRLGAWLQSTAGGAWSGIHVLMDPGASGYNGTLDELNDDILFVDNFQVGNKVKCTGVVNSFGLSSSAPVPGNSQLLLLPLPSSLTGLGSVPAPPQLTIDQFMISDGQGGQITQYETGEQWEGVYIELPNVQIVDVVYGTGSNTGRIFWSVQDANGNKMQVRDVSGWMRNDTSDNFCTSTGSNTPATWDIAPYIGATVSFVKGIVLEYCPSSTGCQYYLSPRDFNDIGVVTAAPPIVAGVTLGNTVPSTTETQTVSAVITDIDGTVSSATLYYSVGLGNTNFSTVTMAPAGNTWSGIIPATGPDSSYVNYWIKATDNLGYSTNYPDSLATNSFYWVKNDGINSIKDVQYNPTGSGTPFLAGKWITDAAVEGTVMATVGFYDLGLTTIQDGTGAWNGIFLRGQNLSTLKRGDKIKITSAKVFENFSVTYLDSTTYLVLSNNNPLYPPNTSVALTEIQGNNDEEVEQYEGLLLGYSDVFVVNQNPDDPSTFGEWSIDNNTSDNAGARCDDYSNDIGFDFGLDSLSINQELDYLYGVLYFSFGNWKLLPRNKDDIAGFKTITGVSGQPVIHSAVTVYPNPATDQLTVVVSAKQIETVSLLVQDLSGKTLLEETAQLAAGENRITINCTNLAAGLYLVELRDKTTRISRKIAVVK